METETPQYTDFCRVIANLALSQFHNGTRVDEAYLREFLVSKVKNIALEKGFRIKMPYADRLDKFKTRTINFYCHMSKSANRKLRPDQQGCQFRAIYKLKDLERMRKDENFNG